MTAVAILRPDNANPLVQHVITGVRMRFYWDADISASIARGDPFDKAGGYAIQDELFRPVESYDGCYCNVVGLPLWTTIGLARKAGLDVPHITAQDLLPQCAACPDAQPW